jgi:hypothetical protein
VPSHGATLPFLPRQNTSCDSPHITYSLLTFLVSYTHSHCSFSVHIQRNQINSISCTQTANADMATDCFCGAVFTTIEALHAHASSLGHLFECHCGTIVESEDALTNHTRDVSHTNPGKPGRYLDLTVPRTDPCKCGICISKSAFKDQHARDHHNADKHNADKHNACPVCAQVFKSTVDRLRHQKAANHCYCAEHNEAFKKPADFAEHKRADVHISSFECTDCQRSFSSDKALDHHLVSDGHARVVAHAAIQAAAIKKAQLEEANLHCEACDRSFVHLLAFRQHKQSVKHKPLSELKCPMSKKCTGTFSSPSALLHHLELGGCKGGMTRNKLNAVVYQHDSDRHITSTAHANRVHNIAVSEASHASMAPSSSASNRARSMSVDSSHTGGGVAIPERSETGSTISPEEYMKARYHNVDKRPHSESKSVKTLAASNNTNSSNGVSVVVTDCDSAISSGTIIYTPTSSGIPSAKNGDDVAVTSSASTTSRARTIYAPSSSGYSDGGVLLTPSASVSGSAALSDWSFLNSSPIMTPSSTSIDGSSVDTITFDTASQRWPCQTCSATFRKKKDLVQHMDSVAHAPKIFHCPTDLPGMPGSRKPTVHFKTLSGLAQHVEAGSRKGGKDTLGFIVGIFESQIQAKLGKSVKLLKE